MNRNECNRRCVCHIRTIQKTCRPLIVVNTSGKLASDLHIRRHPLLHMIATDAKFLNCCLPASRKLCTCRPSVSARPVSLCLAFTTYTQSFWYCVKCDSKILLSWISPAAQHYHSKFYIFVVCLYLC